MPALVVGAVTVGGVIAAVRSAEEGIDRQRAMDGTMLSTRVALAKDAWAIQVTGCTAAELAAIEAALAATPPIACSGDLLGGSVNCHSELHGSDCILGTLPRRFNVTFTLHRS